MFRTRLDHLIAAARTHLARVGHAARSDAGYTTETVVVTALLALLGLTVVGVIVAKVAARANGIDLG
ncbi:hypothetical protein [Streptomyces dysideae]|uniref:Uncharacterized protein n=1 Tax=Streptomyces dysideae TaxID=909626 RepID=A0A117S0F4_9ACTN|nr:hypothetical protein [Streptomyces dysideae]KUO19174.1 hypothetical protein AQJ91_21810 [Streptomyces dysideae]